MAEIILPPEEEQEETPQAPELNIDKPTENSKVITIEFEAKKTNKVSTKDTNQQLYTTDTDAWFEFKETTLENANGTYSAVFRNRHDGSIFQRTGDVVNGVAYYKIPEQEIRHAGAWRGQVVYTLSNGDTTSREFGYDVQGHILDGKDVREIVVEDFETLMSQLRSMKENAEVELASLVSTTQQNETDRQVFFDDLVEDIDGLQANYQELLDTGVLQTNINTKLEALEEEYAPKLTEVTAQLAQKVDEVIFDINEQVIKFYADGALINTIDISAAGNAEAVQDYIDTLVTNGQIEGVTLAEGAVTTRETDFFNHSTNLFNHETARSGAINAVTGEFYESSTWSIVEPIKIDENQTYSCRYLQRISYFNENDEYVGMKNFTSDEVLNGGTFAPNATVAYAIPNIHNNHIELGQINKGNELFLFEPYYVKLQTEYLPEVSIEGGHQKNSIKLEMEHSGIDLDTGLITDATVRNWEMIRRTGKFISVLPSSPISLNYDLGTAYLIEYDKYFEHVRSTSLSSDEETFLTSKTSLIKIMIDDLTITQYPNIQLTYFKGNNTDYIYNNRIDDGYINFIYEVYPDDGREVLDNESLVEQFSPERYFNSGLLKLPPNYDPYGEPIKLIIFNGGANSFLNFEATNLGYTQQLNYWVDEGYAVLGVYDWTTKYEGCDVSFGSPISISARVQAYKWVTENFNIDKSGMYMAGLSAGGYKTFNLAYDKGLPLLAVAGLAPAISPMQRPFGYNKEDRLAYADDFGFEGDTETILGVEASYLSRTPELKEYIRLNAQKLIGYNGYWNGLIGLDFETLKQHAADYTEADPTIFENIPRVSTVPQKIWVAEDDINVSVDTIKNYLQTIKNGQGVGELRLMPNDTGGHWAISTDPNALKVSSITTRLGIEHTNVPLAFAEVIQFFRRYEN